MGVFFFWFIAALAGVLNPIQSGANGTLGKIFGNPYAPVLISLSVSAIFAIAVTLGLRGFGVLEPARAAEAPWWAWLGGFCGAILVYSQPTAAPALGAAVYIGVTVAASLIASIAIDHFGLFGFAEHSASLGRLTGAALMVVGVYLIARF